MPIIKNFGLRWVRDHVDWGSPGKGNEGSLRGKLASARRSSVVDFRDQIGVYVLYEPGFIPVYIGQAGSGTKRLFARLKDHKNDHLRDRWSHFSWFGFIGVKQDNKLSIKQKSSSFSHIQNSSALDEIEGILIQVLEPRLNKQGPKWRKDADEYVQSALVDDSERISELSAKLDEIRSLLTA